MVRFYTRTMSPAFDGSPPEARIFHQRAKKTHTKRQRRDQPDAAAMSKREMRRKKSSEKSSQRCRESRRLCPVLLTADGKVTLPAHSAWPTSACTGCTISPHKLSGVPVQLALSITVLSPHYRRAITVHNVNSL